MEAVGEGLREVVGVGEGGEGREKSVSSRGISAREIGTRESGRGGGGRDGTGGGTPRNYTAVGRLYTVLRLQWYRNGWVTLMRS